MTWLVVILAVAGAAWLWWWWNFYPVRQALEGPGAVVRRLRLLISRGVHKGSIRAKLTICVRDHEEQRLVFEKHIGEDRQFGVRADFPSAAWSVPYFASFKGELVRRGIPHREWMRHDSPVLAFDFGRDFGGAHMVTKLLFEDVMHLKLDRDCVAFFQDIVHSNAPHLTGVDSPNDGWLWEASE